MTCIYGYIYKITNLINGKVYIGQTIKTVMARFKQHVNDSKRAKDGIDAAIRKYGSGCFTVVTIDECNNQADLDNMEVYYIALYRKLYTRKGCYNQTDGGGGCSGYTFSEEQKAKQSMAKKGDKNPNKNGYSRKGKKHTEEAKTKIRISQPNTRKVLQYDLEGNFIREWESIGQASRELKLSHGNISSCCAYKRKRVGNFVFMYKKEENI